jgi:hypothetical protein
MDKLMEKRHYERMNHNAIAILESLNIGVIESNRMLNGSRDGLYFESDQLLLPGSEVFIRIKSHPNSQSGDFRCHHAKIKWGKRLKNSPYAYGYGVKYVVLQNEQGLVETDWNRIKDLRKHPRKYFYKPATIGFENKFYDGVICDISRNGCFIENCESLYIGQIIKLVIPGTKFNQIGKLKVEVSRLSPIGVGVKFKSIINKKTKK